MPPPEASRLGERPPGSAGGEGLPRLPPTLSPLSVPVSPSAAAAAHRLSLV